MNFVEFCLFVCLFDKNADVSKVQVTSYKLFTVVKKVAVIHRGELH